MDSSRFIRLPVWKRTLDLSICILTLPITLPLLGAIALTIKLLSKGPVLFRQERIGFNGEPFVCYKFRTMRADAKPLTHRRYALELRESNEPMTKLDFKGDPRLLPLAWILRAIGLDELPQLINVARGEMSIVGPRPCLPDEYNSYTERERRRFGTYPGLTGLWQVSGKNRTTFEEMVRLDVEYARSQSVWRDLSIIARTPTALLEQFKDSRRGRIDVHCRKARRRRLIAETRQPELPFRH